MESTRIDVLEHADLARPQRILVAEDEEPIRLLWQRFLSRWGYEVDLAENGQVALQLARASRYSLLITDLTMPVMNGLELVHQLKAEQPELEIIVTTGFGTIENAVDMMKAGAHEFITKPISFKHAEMAIQRCLHHVRARQENARLRQVNQDLTELSHMKEKFLAITSHELRTPVTLISNVLEVLGNELDGHPAAPMVTMIERAARQLREIVGEMHELSSATSGNLKLQRTRFDPAGMCGEIFEEEELGIAERGHRVICSVPDGLQVHADRTKLKMALRELVQNAIKFTGDGGTIRVSMDCDASGALRVEVTDDGIGIAPTEQQRIFDLFYEINDPQHHHSSQSRFQGGGMGIGLAMVSEIVKAHNGSIALDSAKGAGATFTVTIPAAQEQPAAPWGE